MFLGHYAVGLAAKKATPKTSLGTLFLSAQFVDLLWPLFLLLGLEHVRIDPGITPVTPLDFYDYPFSHSLLAAIGWSLLLGLAYVAVRRSTKGGLVVGLVAFSHWLLDLITHRPDLPLGFSGGPYVGLGLWNSVAGTLIIEVGLFIAGLALYLHSTKAKDCIGTYGCWGLILVLAGIYAANLFSPPPPGPSEIAVAGNASWLFVFWAYWIDRHRQPTTSGESSAKQ